MTFPNEFPEKIDVHNYDQKIKRQEILLEKAEIKETNKQQIKDFIAFCKADPRVGGSRIRLYLYTLRNIAIWVGDKNFKEMDKKDVVELVTKINEHRFLPKKCLFYFNLECDKKGATGKERERLFSELTEKESKKYSPDTIDDYLKTIKKFWKWLHDTDKDDPPQTRWIRRRNNANDKEPQIFTRDEIKRLIEGCNNIRDKAFFICLYDLDCRVSELLTRQIKHIKYDEDGDIQVLIESDKTCKKHWEVLFESSPLFATWLKLHPSPNEPNAPLWTHLTFKGKVKMLQYANIRKVFIHVCKKQNIRPGKRNHMHMLRKSKATHDMFDRVPLPVIESRGSWAKGSKALRECYIAVEDGAKKDTYKKKYGLPCTNGIKNSEPLELKRCERCRAILENGSKFCANCGFCVDKTLREANKKANDEIASLVDKEMISEMIKKIVLETMSRNDQKK